MKHPTHVYLYSEPTAASLRLSELAHYVNNVLPWLDVSIRDSFVRFHLSTKTDSECEEIMSTLAHEFARAKVRDPSRQLQDFVPLPGEVGYERRRLTTLDSKVWGILYDGYRLMSILRGLICREERNLGYVHIVFTNQLFGTWDDGDQRYHARVTIYGFPSLISTSGIVEAPAKPREYYLLKQQYAALGMPDATAGLDDQFQGQFIAHGDERLTEVLKGYVIQAILHHLWGEPFCSDEFCRLYNAHWQQEVIQAQLDGDYEYCPFHEEKLKQLNEVFK